MVGKPPPIGPSSPDSSKEAQKAAREAELMRESVPGKGIKAKPMRFLGMDFNAEQAAQLWQVVIQAIGREISKENQKMLKAIRKMKPDEDPDSD